jgi:hypothetical protein
MDRQARLRAGVARLQEQHPRIAVYDALKRLCDAASCYAATEGVLLFEDSHHLSGAGSVMVARDLLGSIAIAGDIRAEPVPEGAGSP